MSRAINRAQRLREMELLFLERPYSDQEMADALGVRRETAYEDRVALETQDEIPFIEVERGRRRIDRTRYLPNLRVNLHEQLALYLALRRVSRQTRTAQPHVRRALEKIALILKQPMTQQLINVAGRIAQQPPDPARVKVIEDLAQGWALKLKVQIHYDALRGDGDKVHLISPYLIEPSNWSDAVYVIAASHRMSKPTPFNLARITQTFVTSEPFQLPEDFDDTELLRFAWGVWTRDREPETVKLKFTGPEAIKRMQETIWHPLQKELEQLPDGSWLWQAPIAEWHEMLPWVRGWGADVQVLEPEGLRAALTREAKKLAELYEVMQVPSGQVVYYAHTKEGKDESEWQELIDHLTRVGNYAAGFGRDAGVSELAKIAGLMHDLGKYSKEFQARLRGSNRKVDHATAGAKELIHLYKDTPQQALATLLAYCISGHHTGLLDYGNPSDLPGDGTLQARLKTDVCDYSAYRTELDLSALAFPNWLNTRPLRLRFLPDKPVRDYQGFSISFATRMVFSALVDADFQDTEEFVKHKQPRGQHSDIEDLRNKFNAYARRFDPPDSEINRRRTETLDACRKQAVAKPGFFKLTVPTGGGKTLASMAFALNHAATHGLKRIIYVIPFTTIIEQNAGVFEDILGQENVLEHHSNFDREQTRRQAIEMVEDQTNSVYAKLKLAAENWDIPIVVTTNVQFFESLFANRYARCRKLHNIAKSVLIFDEAQMFPKDYLYPAMSAVWELVINYGASAVFCTATQPKLEKFLPPETEIQELAPNPSALFDFYKRVQVKQLGKLTDDELIARLHEREQILCIVNTRKHASGLFQNLSALHGEGNYHLSTLMCPAHRKQKLAEIRSRLESQQPCRVVSTSVMEAGIDVDFPIGYRALAGLDSINQAAGRVNRNMRSALGELCVFEPVSDFIKRTPRYVAQGVEVTRGVLRDHRDAPISIAAIEAYYERLYALKEPRDFDMQDVLGSFRVDSQNQPVFNFATVGKNFRVIEDVTQTVILPFNEEAKKLIQELQFTPYPFSTLRKLQPYTVSIYEGEFDTLSSRGVILSVAETHAVLNPDFFDEYYHPDTGLRVPATSGGDAIIA